MTTATAPPAVPMTPAAQAGKVTQVRVLNSEWIKLRTLRSTFWSLFAAIVVTVGLSTPRA